MFESIVGDDRSGLRDLARRLSAYIPATLAEQILRGGIPTPGQGRPLKAATLFSDISGFAAMAEKLASYGPRGAEELNRVLLQTFTAMINAIHDAGGAVSHFYGDAMAVYFPDHDGRAAERALACARYMQSLMQTNFRQVVTYRQGHPPTIFDLSMKIGVGYGRCVEMVVGDPTVTCEFVVAGAAVDEAATAQLSATAGQIIASRTVLERAGLPVEGDFRPVTDWLRLPSAQATINWDAYPREALVRLIDALRAFIPAAIYERLTAVNAHFVAEHRPATSIFVRFSGIDFDGDNAGNLLQLYYEWVRKIVARYGGENSRLNRVIVGDKGNHLHIIFGAPMAPDAPEQAIRCALALQRERPAFLAAQQIGLVGGRVFAGPVGSQSRREYTVVGDAVNLSARLAEISHDGFVLTDMVTANRVRASIDFERLPDRQIRGKEEPVPLYRAIGGRAEVTRLAQRFAEPSSLLVGRQKELDLLLGGLDAALRGIGGMAAVASPAGVGSARLMAAGVEYWLKSGGAGYYGFAQPHTNDVPYSLWLNVWRDFFGLHSAMSTREQGEVIVSRVESLYPAGVEDASLWGEAMGIPMRKTARLALLNPEARHSRLYPLIRRCFRAATSSHPLFVVLEDVHWADNISLDLLDDFAAHLGDMPVFIGLTYHQDSDFTLPVQTRPNCVPIILGDLTTADARQLVQRLVGETNLPLAIEQHLGLRDRDGRSSPVDPLFLEEALKMMLERGVLQRNGRLRVNEELLDRLPVPETIHTLLLARLDHLPPPSRNLLQQASVIGRQFDLEMLASINKELTDAVIRERLDELVAAGMIQLVTARPQPTYIFQHAMLHEVVYNSLPYAQRHAHHLLVAEWLARRYARNQRPIMALLAYHYGRTEEHAEALRCALIAADDAYNILANQEAVDLYTLAEGHLRQLGLEENWQTAVRIYLARGEALRLMGDVGEAIADARRARLLAEQYQDEERIARSYNLSASLYFQQTRYQKARELAGVVMEQLNGRVPTDELARAYMWSGLSASALHDYDPALADLRQSERLCLETGNNQRLARVLSAIALIHYERQEIQPALATMHRAVDLARDFGSPAQIGEALYQVAQAQFRLGEAEAALTSLMEVIRLARSASRNLLGRALTRWAEVLTYLGRFSEAQVVFQEAAHVLQMMDDERGLVELYLLWGNECYTPQGQWKLAQRSLMQAQRLLQRAPDKYREELARLLLAMAQVELHAGQSVRADRFLRKAESLVDEVGRDWWRPAIAYWKGLTCLALGRDDAAMAAFRRGLRSALTLGCPDYLPLLYLELARLESNQTQRVEYLTLCVRAAKKRARQHDRAACLAAVAVMRGE